MTQITINNKTSSLSNHNLTINEYIDEIIAKVAQDEDVVTAITLDGVELDANIDNDLFLNSIQEFDQVNFTIQTSTELAFEALDSCSTYIDIVIEKVQLLVTLFADNKKKDANNLFAESIEIMDLFIQLMSKINRTIQRTVPDLGKSETIKQLEIHLLSVLKALIPAKEKDDIIMLCDLLEYELIDNLTRWKINAIPELRKLKDN